MKLPEPREIVALVGEERDDLARAYALEAIRYLDIRSAQIGLVDAKLDVR